MGRGDEDVLEDFTLDKQGYCEEIMGVSMICQSSFALNIRCSYYEAHASQHMLQVLLELIPWPAPHHFHLSLLPTMDFS